MTASKGEAILRQMPWITLFLMLGPVLAGLAGTLIPALSGGPDAPFRRLFDWAGLWPAIRLSVVTGVVSTALSLAITLGLTAALFGTTAFRRIERMLAPFLSLPHAAAALGIAFLIAPSGWIARALAGPLGWDVPPDLLILNDPMGLALIGGLVAKEVPFLLLMTLAALPQTDARRRLTVTQSLGYGQVAGFVLTVLPALHRQLRLPVLAVLAYSMTAVEMALILGPSLPPTLSVQVVIWMNDPSLQGRDLASAGATLQFALVVAVLGLWRLAEVAVRHLLILRATSGQRGIAIDLPVRIVAQGTAGVIAASMAAGLAGLMLWSFAGQWTFPAPLPDSLTLSTWNRAFPDLAASAGMTFWIGALATFAALILVTGCLEAETRLGLRPGPLAQWMLYLPLLVPQVAFLPGLQGLLLRLGLDGTAVSVAAAHFVFVLPYVFLSLAAPWRAWDRRLGTAAAALGASESRIFWRLRLPMLLAPALTAAAVGFAVSVGQYLPTLLVGGGRVETVTTAAVALSSGGNRRLIGAYGLLQMLLPALAFGLALVVPALLWRNRQQMRGRA